MISGVAVGDIQDNVVFTTDYDNLTGTVTGTLKFIQGGLGDTAPLKGDGYFFVGKAKVNPNENLTALTVGATNISETSQVDILPDINEPFAVRLTDDLSNVRFLLATWDSNGRQRYYYILNGNITFEHDLPVVPWIPNKGKEVYPQLITNQIMRDVYIDTLNNKIGGTLIKAGITYEGSPVMAYFIAFRFYVDTSVVLTCSITDGTTTFNVMDNVDGNFLFYYGDSEEMVRPSYTISYTYTDSDSETQTVSYTLTTEDIVFTEE